MPEKTYKGLHPIFRDIVELAAKRKSSRWYRHIRRPMSVTIDGQQCVAATDGSIMVWSPTDRKHGPCIPEMGLVCKHATPRGRAVKLAEAVRSVGVDVWFIDGKYRALLEQHGVTKCRDTRGTNAGNGRAWYFEQPEFKGLVMPAIIGLPKNDGKNKQ